MDIWMLLVIAALFVASLGLVALCQRLREDQ